METKQFEYKNSAETDEKVHKIELYADGKNVGFANLEYSGNPFPFYYLSLMFVNEEDRGKKFGSDVLKEVMVWLDKKNRPAFLLNAIEPDSPAYSMYEKYGWKPVFEKEYWFSYNLPQDLDRGRISKAIHSIEETRMKKLDKEFLDQESNVK